MNATASVRLSIISLAILISGSLESSGQAGLPDPLKPSIPGLPSADPASVNMSSDTITRLIQLIRSTPPNDFREIVVLKDNKIVVEEYFNTYWRETIHDVRSAGKSITALLVGIAIDKGLIRNVEQSIFDFFPGTDSNQEGKQRVRISIKDLLTMSSGLDVDDNDVNSPGGRANWLTKDDWIGFALSLPMKFSPGKRFVYNDVCPMLTGTLIEEASGKRLADFADENLLKPLGIREFYWYTARNGRTGPMGNLYISTLDFARIGQLVLNEGRWQGRQIVSANWIREMCRKRFDISEEDPFADSYGYFWYSTSKEVHGKSYNCIYAAGNGGNLLFIVPEANLVVSLSSSAYGLGYGHQRSHNIFQSVLSALSN